MMPLFRGKKKLPEVNYFKGGSSWVNYVLTVDIDDYSPMLLLGSTFGIYSYDYADAVKASKPYTFDFDAGATGATVFGGLTTGITITGGVIPLLLATITATGTITLTFKNCFVNKVFTIEITA